MYGLKPVPHNLTDYRLSRIAGGIDQKADGFT